MNKTKSTTNIAMSSSSTVQSSQQILNSSQTEKKNDRCASVSFTSSQHVHQPLPKRPSSSKVYISFYIDSHHSGLFPLWQNMIWQKKLYTQFFLLLTMGIFCHLDNLMDNPTGLGKVHYLALARAKR